MVNLNPKKTVLASLKPGDYMGQDGQQKLNAVVSQIHQEVISAIKEFSQSNLIKVFYGSLDYSCLLTLDGTHWIGEERTTTAVSEAPAISRYLLEASLLYSGLIDDKTLDDETLKNFYLAGQMIVENCNSSNAMYYAGYSVGIRIHPDGYIEDIIEPKVKEAMDKFVIEMRHRKQTVLNKTFTAKYKDYFADFPNTEFGKQFASKYGFSLKSVIQTALTIYDIGQGSIDPVITSRKALVAKITVKTKMSKQEVDKALAFFEICKASLEKEWKYYKLQLVQTSITRKPIINLSGKIGASGTLVYGNNTILYALAMLLNDIERGVVDLGIDTNSISRKRGYEFEKKVLSKLKSHGFVASRLKKVPSNVGEIDAVAAKEDKGLLLVVEAKSPTITLDVKKITRQMNDSIEWYQQLDRKVKWVERNLEFIKASLKIDTTKTFQVEGIVVVDVPWYHENHPKYRLITSDEFDLFLRIRTTF